MTHIKFHLYFVHAQNKNQKPSCPQPVQIYNDRRLRPATQSLSCARQNFVHRDTVHRPQKGKWKLQFYKPLYCTWGGSIISNVICCYCGANRYIFGHKGNQGISSKFHQCHRCEASKTPGRTHISEAQRVILVKGHSISTSMPGALSSPPAALG